jgi:hypothetical protein
VDAGWGGDRPFAGESGSDRRVGCMRRQILLVIGTWEMRSHGPVFGAPKDVETARMRWAFERRSSPPRLPLSKATRTGLS